MFNPFKFYSKDCPKSFVPISNDNASKLLGTFNIYMTFYTHELDFNIQDINYYQLSLKETFDTQHAIARILNLHFKNQVYYFTDYKQNEFFYEESLYLAKKELESKKKKITVTNLYQITKISKTYLTANFQRIVNPLQRSLF